jgi:hypothetical protein
MAKLGTTIRPHDHDTEQQDFELLPDGIYRLEVSASDVKKDDDGNTVANFTIEVVEPEDFAKRRFFTWVDIEHREAEKQARGQREISKMSRAMFGADAPENIDDSEELHFRTFTARVKRNEAGVSKAGRPYKAKNSISKYFYSDEGELPEPEIFATQPATTRTAPANDNRQAPANDNRAAARPAAAAAGSKPWRK